MPQEVKASFCAIVFWKGEKKAPLLLRRPVGRSEVGGAGGGAGRGSPVLSEVKYLFWASRERWLPALLLLPTPAARALVQLAGARFVLGWGGGRAPAR